MEETHLCKELLSMVLKNKIGEDIYGFDVSEGFISDVTDKILPQIEEWQNRELDDIYPVYTLMPFILQCGTTA